jgi:membrane protein
VTTDSLPDPNQPPPRDDAVGPGRAARIAKQPDAHRLGRDAATPAEIPWLGWKAVLRRVAYEMVTDRVSLTAAGCAFYATLALFPALSMLILIYGLAFEPATVEPQLAALRDILPPVVYTLIAQRIHTLVTQPAATLGWGLVLSTGVTLWSSVTGIKGIITALNIAYEEVERRSIFRYQVETFTITFCAILGAALGLVLLLGVPVVLTFLGASTHQQVLVRLASLGLLVLFLLVGLSFLYRYGPCRTQPRWHWVTPGSLVATVLWVVASVLFSLYVTRIAHYDLTYGPLAAVAGVMMWFWITIYVVLLGAELNAELELQTVLDSTDGPPKPLGKRGAYVADHVAEE